MGVFREQLEHGSLKKYVGGSRNGWRKWAKKQMNRLIRRDGRLHLDEAETRKRYKGWEL